MRTVAAKPTEKLNKLDSLEKNARAALEAQDWFKADRDAFEAISIAYAMDLYDRMPAMVEVLKEARGRRFREALNTGVLYTLDDPEARDEMFETQTPEELTPGCYLVEPPLVGADGRNLRDHFFSLGVPALFIVREPKTRAGKWPIVMIGPITVRAYVEPPEDDEPTLEWMEDAAYELGDSAIEMVNAEADATVRVNELLDRLGTVVLHDRLLDLLAQTCAEAHKEVKAAKDARDKKAAEKAGG